MRKLIQIERLSLRHSGDDLLTGLVFYLLTLGAIGYLLSPMVDLPSHVMIMILAWPIGFLAILLSLPGHIKRLMDNGMMDRLRQMGYSPTNIMIAAWAMRCLVIAIGIGVVTLIIILPNALDDDTFNISQAVKNSPDTNSIMFFILSLLIGIPGISAIIQFGEILGMVNQTGRVMMAVITMPLAIPLMIFGVSIGLSAHLGQDLGALFPIFTGLTLIIGGVSLFASHIILTRYAHE